MTALKLCLFSQLFTVQPNNIWFLFVMKHFRELPAEKGVSDAANNQHTELHDSLQNTQTLNHARTSDHRFNCAWTRTRHTHTHISEIVMFTTCERDRERARIYCDDKAPRFSTLNLFAFGTVSSQLNHYWHLIVAFWIFYRQQQRADRAGPANHIICCAPIRSSSLSKFVIFFWWPREDDDV